MEGFNVLAIFFFFPLLFSSNLFHVVSTANDTLSPDQSIIDGETLISSGGSFEFGFFSPSGSNNRYLGIWFHNIADQTVVWVANPQSPTTGSSGVLYLTSYGDLIVQDQRYQIWSTETYTSSVTPTAQLLDSGNLVILNDSKGIVWQSFDYPSDTLLPGMKLRWDLRAYFERHLSSWTSTSDPSPGNYSLAMDLRGSPEMYIWNGRSPIIYLSDGSEYIWNGSEYIWNGSEDGYVDGDIWKGSELLSRSGPWDGKSLGGAAAPMTSNDLFTFRFVAKDDEVYCAYEISNQSIVSRLVVTEIGKVQHLLWLGNEWTVHWFWPRDQCDDYAVCGAFGVCNISESPICKCLDGFKPNSPKNWNLKDFSDGCIRRTPLNCLVGEGFLKVENVKLPKTSSATDISNNMVLDACRASCLNNCSCIAFALLGGEIGCITWYGDLIDIRELSLDLGLGDGDDLYVRLAASELDKSSKEAYHQIVAGRRRHVLMIAITTSIALLILITIMCVMWKRRHIFKGMRKVRVEQPLFTLETNLANKLGETPHKNLEFTLFQFSSIVQATNNFSDSNKLGAGGFGHVYKGELPDGQEIAVKRLDAHSSQGLDEFKNEILLIARLQHINLVKLLGCCINGEEKILIYEYMSNKSLDFFLFDPTKRAQLDWCKRFCIIEGIAQGLLYLHKHSRVRIIHRDLKASNILLDDEMNPKISDFGMARIFGSNEIQANTKNIVGTYGYISPEYAAEGLFSIKSDVFSFGVILLEIVTGNRNTNFYQYGDSFNLLGYVWELWKAGKWLESVDPSFDDRYNMFQISRSIHVALLCVQESYIDRPTISDVITMMRSESIALPDPKQPAFFNVRIASEEGLLSNNSKFCSLNNVTITNIDG